MDKNLIIDIGMHKLEDTAYYLSKGYNVVAVDADPNLIKAAHDQYIKYVDSKQLQLLNFAISENDNEEVTFNVGEKTIWNSLKKSITDRKENQSRTITVKTRKLSTIIEMYGNPFYCKIDIEGYDVVALSTIKNSTEHPTYISVETECVGANETFTEDEALATLRMLNTLGYNRFKLVDQISHTVLEHQKTFYTESQLFLYQFFNKWNFAIGNRRRVQKKCNYEFPLGASGPFAEEIDGTWISYNEAEKTLLKHRRDYFSLKRAVNYGFWCDWHAKKQ